MKSQGLSIRTIVLIILILIVLAAVIIFFFVYQGKLNTQTNASIQVAKNLTDLAVSG